MLFFIISELLFIFFFFFNDTATTEIYTLSLHDALPIYEYYSGYDAWMAEFRRLGLNLLENRMQLIDRKSTRLNSSHGYISYAVFCLKKKKNTQYLHYTYQLPPLI